MEFPMPVDISDLARQLDLPPAAVQHTIELLDDGNTVPFITRYRRDQTGGLDETQIRKIESRVDRHRALEERKETILRAIRTRDQLTDELAARIRAARSPKLLEDLYLPYKIKKQTRAMLARERGLEPLADKVLDSTIDQPLDELATEFIDADKELPTLKEVSEGVRELIAERFSENSDLRQALRRVFRRTGTLVSKRLEHAERETPDSSTAEKNSAAARAGTALSSATTEPLATDSGHPGATATAESTEGSDVVTAGTATCTDGASATTAADDSSPPSADSPLDDSTVDHPTVARSSENEPSTPIPAAPTDLAEPNQDGQIKSDVHEGKAAQSVQSARKEARRQQRRDARHRKRKKLESSFHDYFDFRESITKIREHRVLAINRGERVRVLQAKIEVDDETIRKEAEAILVPEEHPRADFLRGCLKESLSRHVLPSLEREVRRDLTERAEAHAVEVFSRNLRQLLLQQPVQRRVLAIDPGYRSGCKIVALDEFGNVLEHGHIYVIGEDDRKQAGRRQVIDFIRRHQLSAVAIGNGSGCRETEQFIGQLIEAEFKDDDVAYVIVNEAGASVYSTSVLAGEELPNYEAIVRGAVSIGRRLLDPLSELVKIEPGNIGVGMYQHDIKAKPLQESLDAAVQSCVNFVGVDVNTASPALLRYVSGLNQLTARRLYEYRTTHGPFRSREQLKEVAGIGESTFVQAAGFLKVNGGDNPLDATWIHPESYAAAEQVLQRLGATIEDLSTHLKAVTAKVVQREPNKTPETISENTDATPSPTESAAANLTDEKASQDTVQLEQGVRDEVDATGKSSEHDQPIPPQESAPSPAETSQDGAARASATAETPSHETISDSDAWDLRERTAHIEKEKLAAELGIGKLLIEDIVTALSRPGRDPRKDLPPPVFRHGIMKLEDLKPGMELAGTVLNVVDFGVFVDVGLSETGLVHISRLADHFVRDPQDLVSVGDSLRVWVVSVDKQRRRVALTAIEKGKEKSRKQRSQDKATIPSANRSRGERGRRSRKEAPPRQHKQKPRKPSRPVTPITDAMKEGSEPMRAFSDLVQFFDHSRKDRKSPRKTDDSSTKKKNDKD